MVKIRKKNDERIRLYCKVLAHFFLQLVEKFIIFMINDFWSTLRDSSVTKIALDSHFPHDYFLIFEIVGILGEKNIFLGHFLISWELIYGAIKILKFCIQLVKSEILSQYIKHKFINNNFLIDKILGG